MNDFLQPTGRRRTWLIAAVLVAVVVIVLVVGLLVEGAGDPDGDALPPPSTSSASSGPSTSTPSAEPTEGELLRLVAGRRRVSGVAVGYPHSVAGAVSAAVEIWTQVGSTLDPDRAAAIGRLVADESWTNAPDEFAAGPKNSRRRLGLSASGDVGPEASIVVEAAGYQLRNKSSERVTVLLLGYLTTNSPSKGSQTQVGVFPATLHWSTGDWKIEKGDGTDYGDLAQQPGTAEAASAGWLEFVR